MRSAWRSCCATSVEHQRAGDTTLLSLAQLVLVAMPWNPLAWWQVRRLRLAIELDCDARVLRAEPDVRSYGTLLLEVGRPNGRFALAGAALSDRAGDLEQRIRMMTRRAKGLSRAGAGALARRRRGGDRRRLQPSCAGASGAAPTAARPTHRDTRRRSSRRHPRLRRRGDCGDGSGNAEAERQRHPTRANSARAAALYADVSARLRDLRGIETCQRGHVARAGGRRASPTTDRGRARDGVLDQSVGRDARRAAVPDSVGFRGSRIPFTACSSGLGSDDSYVVKLLVADSLARRDGRIEIAGRRRRPYDDHAQRSPDGLAADELQHDPCRHVAIVRTGSVSGSDHRTDSGPSVGDRDDWLGKAAGRTSRGHERESQIPDVVERAPSLNQRIGVTAPAGNSTSVERGFESSGIAQCGPAFARLRVKRERCVNSPRSRSSDSGSCQLRL